jgi:hypothetical protein
LYRGKKKREIPAGSSKKFYVWWGALMLNRLQIDVLASKNTLFHVILSLWVKRCKFCWDAQPPDHSAGPCRTEKREIQLTKNINTIFKLLTQGISSLPFYSMFCIVPFMSKCFLIHSNNFQIGKKTCHEVASATIPWAGPRQIEVFSVLNMQARVVFLSQNPTEHKVLVECKSKLA